MKDLKELYAEWRKVMEEANEGLDHNIRQGSLDCGEGAVREDFSNFAELENEISFDEMYELEKDYERGND